VERLVNRQFVGEAELLRIDEMVDMSWKPESFFRNFDADVIDAQLDWLVPGHYRKNQGCLVMSVHSWVVRTERHTVLIDSCIGNQKDRMPRASWHNLDTPFLHRLRNACVDPQEVDYVMCTHMHADHVGWNTMLKNGSWIPTFPNARYVFGRAEYEHWLKYPSRSPIHRNAFNDSVLPVVAAGQAELVDDGYQLDDNFVVELAPGHTPGNVIIRLSSKQSLAIFAGDVVHHPLQIYHPEWSTIGCLDPEESVATRRQTLESCCEQSALLVPAHFAAPHAGYVRDSGVGFEFEWLEAR
jgi:glyoxylase-like metal-dependent hydrolase (beta-lactamase superfamily II)